MAKELKPGMQVKVYEDPKSCLRFEGEAELIKPLRIKDDPHMEYWQVRLLGEIRSWKHHRWINKLIY